MLDTNKQKALNELLEVLGKGVDLLMNDNIDKDLYVAYEKYVTSTIKLVENAYQNSFSSIYSSPQFYGYGLNSYSNYDSLYTSPVYSYSLKCPNIYTGYSSTIQTNNIDTLQYKQQVRDLVLKLISIAKMVVYK